MSAQAAERNYTPEVASAPNAVCRWYESSGVQSMKKAILIGLLAVLWLALKMMLRWFGKPGVQNPGADLALLLVVAAAAVVVGVFLMKAEEPDSQKKAKPQSNIAASTAPLAPGAAPPPTVSAPSPARTEAAAFGRAPGDVGTVVCPACGAQARGGKFCQACGGELRRNTACPQCGVQFQDGAKFCRECGTRVV
jgi:hypothetical protein